MRQQDKVGWGGGRWRGGVAILSAWAGWVQAGVWLETPFDANTASVMQGNLDGGPNRFCNGIGDQEIYIPGDGQYHFRNNDPSEPHLYQSYTLYNNGPARCVWVKPVWTHQDCGNLEIGVSLYLGSFNPADPTQNLLAHSFEDNQSFWGGKYDPNDYRHSPGYFNGLGGHHLDDKMDASALVPALSTIVVVLDSRAHPGDNLTCPINDATSSFGIMSAQLDDTPLTVEVHDTSAYESSGFLQFHVSLSTQFNGTFTVDYATGDVSAVAGGADPDYGATSGQLTFLPGETTKFIQVPIVNDAIDETPPAGESMTLTLSNPGSPYVALAQASATGTIYDDDDLTGTCHIVNYTGGGDLPLGKVGQAYGPVELEPDGEAAGSNYGWSLVSGSLPPGIALSTNPHGSAMDPWGVLSGTPTQAGAYAFTLGLQCPTLDSSFENVDVPFTLVVDSETPQAILTLPDVTVVEGNAGLTPVNMAFQLSQALPDDLPLEIVLFDGSATVVDPDYQQLMSIPQPTQITAGNTVEPFQLNVLGDVKVEGNETYLVQVRTPVEKTVLATATVTILNDDAQAVGPASPIPALGFWGLGLLAGLLGGLGAWRRGRTGAA